MFSYDPRCEACLFHAQHSQAEHETNIFDWYAFNRPDGDEVSNELRDRISRQLKQRSQDTTAPER